MKPFKAVSFPWGGGGNHLIHLMSLDSSFDCIFQSVHGIEDPTVKNKLEYIKKNIYPSTRTWHNWLPSERRYRSSYSEIIQIRHEYWEWADRSDPDHPTNNIPPGSRILFLEFETLDTAMTHYLHLNLHLNNDSPTEIARRFRDWQVEMVTIKSQNLDCCKFINGEILHHPILDSNFYEECCDWFQVEKFYDQACEIHNAWMQCRRQSARDFHDYFTGEEFTQYLEKLKKFEITIL